MAQLGSQSFSSRLPADATNVRIEGYLSATGGMGNDIIVYVMSEDASINWSNRHGADAQWESVRTTVGDVSAKLPDGGGTFYLVFDNTFSFLSPKAVQQNIALTYYSQERQG